MMFKELLSSKSDTSMMRFLSLISLLVGGGIAIYGVYVGRDLLGLSALCGVFVSASFGGKISQKLIESKTSVNNNVTSGDA
jgi:hypothetical protein